MALTASFFKRSTVIGCIVLLLFFVIIFVFSNSNTGQATKNEITQPSVVPTTSDKNYSYIAAVVNYNPTTLENGILTELENARRYAQIVKISKNYSADIIVFPELGVTYSLPNRSGIIEQYSVPVPSPNDKIAPCDQDNSNEILKTLSCAAKDNKMYMVVNLLELIKCSNNGSQCTSADDLIYLTNVAFDRNGTVIARYRKFNLYTERSTFGMNTTDDPEYSIFTTDFGSTFGMFICFDIMFQKPAVKLVTEKNVTDIAYSVRSYPTYPFHNAMSSVFGWAYALNVNFLSSSAELFHTEQSGIIAGRNGLLPMQSIECVNATLFVAEVPKKSSLRVPNDTNSNAVCDNNTYTPPANLDLFKIADISLNTSNTFYTYTAINFTCSINASLDMDVESDEFEYRYTAFAGRANFSTASFNNYVEICGLVLCWKNSTACLMPNVLDTKSMGLRNVTVHMTSMDSRFLQIAVPYITNSYLCPISVSDFTFESVTQDGLNEVRMELPKKYDGLMNFAVYRFPDKSNPL